MIIIPAIDIIDGKCVRLSQGDYGRKTVYNEDPLEVALMFRDNGIKRLHLVDLDGARAGRIINYKVLERISRGTDLVIDFGGGLKADEDLKIAFESGAAMITGGTIAVKKPDIFIKWLELYGSERIILGSDHRAGKISVSGWTEDSDVDLKTFLSGYTELGVKKTICTDISVDGMLSGPSTGIYRELLSDFPEVELIASGGVGHAGHLEELKSCGIREVIVGKAFYEGRISMKEIQEFLTN